MTHRLQAENRSSSHVCVNYGLFHVSIYPISRLPSSSLPSRRKYFQRNETFGLHRNVSRNQNSSDGGSGRSWSLTSDMQGQHRACKRPHMRVGKNIIQEGLTWCSAARRTLMSHRVKSGRPTDLGYVYTGSPLDVTLDFAFTVPQPLLREESAQRVRSDIPLVFEHGSHWRSFNWKISNPQKDKISKSLPLFPPTLPYLQNLGIY